MAASNSWTSQLLWTRPGSRRPHSNAEAQGARFAAHGGVGIAQRFGLFYGWDSTHTVAAIVAAQAGVVPVLGPDTACLSSVTTDDAASAALAALVAPSGIYNVVDDRPLRRREYVSALTDALGASLRERPVETFEVPSDFRMMLRSLRVTNERFRAVTGWRPHHPSGWQGWTFVINDWRNHPLTTGD